MSRELRIVGTFATPVEADAVRALLDAAGIRSVLADEATVGMNWLLGNAVRGVKVLVADDDLVRAVQIVSEAADAAQEIARRNDKPPDWKCLLCGEEVSGDFDVCWSCGATRDGAADPEFERDAEAEEAGAAASGEELDAPQAAAAQDEPPPARTDESNPFRSPLAPLAEEPQEAKAEEEHEFSEDDEVAFRAWKASIIGLAICPPVLQLYSTTLLLSLAFNERPLGPKAARRYVVAWMVNILVVGLAGAQIAWLLR